MSLDTYHKYTSKNNITPPVGGPIFTQTQIPLLRALAWEPQILVLVDTDIALTHIRPPHPVHTTNTQLVETASRHPLHHRNPKTHPCPQIHRPCPHGMHSQKPLHLPSHFFLLLPPFHLGDVRQQRGRKRCEWEMAQC